MDSYRPADLEPGSMDVEQSWAGPSFADALQGRSRRKPFYMGEDEVDNLDDLTLPDVFEIHDQSEDLANCPFVDLNWDRYKQQWAPWQRALILKVLGKNFSLKVLEPRIKQAWQLKEGCDLIDLDKGYLVARFYNREDYLTALEGGPWMVLGHYLMISKWKPNFVPSDTGVSTTRV